MEKNVLLIALGGIGFRHFQALLNCEQSIRLYVVDINENALNHAREYAESIDSNMNICYLRDVSDVPEHVHVAIIATSSLPRRSVFESLIEAHTVDNVIFEKVLFPRIDDYDAVEEILNKRGIKAYVDCVARTYPVYHQIREECKNSQYFIASMKGSNWGLACNAIHLIDEIAYISGENPVNVTCTGLLDNEIVNAKRDGYIEFYGKIVGRLGRKCRYLIECDHGNNPLVFEFFTDTSYYCVNEAERTLTKGIYNNSHEVITTTIDISYVSQVTNRNVDELLKGEAIDLPSFEESKLLHIAMLRMFLEHMNTVKGTKEELCPIT